jgi:PPOX class probable F420-dependent enzyme
VSLIVDHYDDDWSALWWVRLRGTAGVHESGPAFDRAIDTLVEKYPQYRQRPPEGPAIVVDITEWAGWTAG